MKSNYNCNDECYNIGGYKILTKLVMKMKINLEVIEMMMFFWHSTRDNEKVSDVYLSDLAARREMEVLFTDDFNEQSIKTVLSAITNREMLSTRTKSEGLFWNNNMWMSEDLSITQAMIDPIKSLNLDDVESDIEIVFIPGHSELYYIKDQTLYINFFKVMVDVFTGSMEVTIDKMAPRDFILSKITEVV